jgi:hypothetical protein
MKKPERLKLDDHRFTTVDYPVVGFLIRVAEIAERLGFEAETWEEDGLGTAHGLWVRLPSGRIILLRELEYLIKRGREKGPYAYLDGIDVAGCAIEALIDEVVDGLGLPKEVVGWVATEEQRGFAMDMLERLRQGGFYKG